MYYDVPEGLGLRKIASDLTRFTPERKRQMLSGLARAGALGQLLPSIPPQMRERISYGRVKNAPAIPQRPGIPAPADDPAPANQRPTGYGATPKPAPSTWTQKIQDYKNGLAGPVNAPIEFRRHMHQQGQRLINSPFAQGILDRMRGGSK